MPYAALEKKIAMVPPQFMDELSAFVEFSDPVERRIMAA